MTETAQAEVGSPTDEGDAGDPSVVHVATTVAHPVDAVWRTIISPSGVEALLGSGVVLGGKGEPWHAADGSHGVLRSYHALEQVRVSWHADDTAPATLIDLHLESTGAGTRLDLRHEHLDASPGLDREALAARWSTALARVGELSG